ncbi:acetyl-CoA synthetase-like protein [Aspergillus eucalypticola CBS 122712]|uniref:Acetyl-CoA synthetase-like protein n=1 Tax=Aspergillus eucalypticola (strain CBS 122712 / IBT 29274) TaxID=1448314 RepID=A0A317UX47_ASPEC|nr:acetyl-CoA synthetase-like protein [Aspergillus eucalypticola CBS 122712]PWY65929.1 acetyl-CoA synthetase-like protein [Aspergillus eucalypticola CBS 122712]
MTPPPAIVHGPTEPALWHKTLGDLIDEQEAHYRSKEAVVVPWQSVRLSYSQLAERSRVLAQAMLDMGLRPGDCVGIMAGNCYQYIEVFLGGGRIGCPVVVLNNTYTPSELTRAVHQSSCKLVFISSVISTRSLSDHIHALQGEQSPNPKLPQLRRIVLIGDGTPSSQTGINLQPYDVFTSTAHPNPAEQAAIARTTSPEDVLNLQFTSGTTGSPKAAMLTHNNLINNARFFGQGLALTPQDIILTPPPLFHCFGLVLGFLSSFIHGSTIIFPSASFSAPRCVDALLTEHATVVLGVPTMYLAILEALAHTGTKPSSLRVALASGSPVSPTLMTRLQTEMGIPNVLIAYGMTETSPVTFMTGLGDDAEKGLSTVGRVVPHTWAKVVDREGSVVARGVRGELCTAGFALQKGYWRNVKKTAEVMRRDEQGVLWMFTGDEVVMDAEGFVAVTGRIKDVIIRGGENIFPREIEERLTTHPSISEASVVGIKNERYGEVVGAFLKASEKVSPDELRHYVSQTLGRHKAPQHIFWIGDAGVGTDFPKTGSGKHQKHLLRDLGNRLVRAREVNRARL